MENKKTDKRTHSGSINFQLLTIVFVGAILIAATLTAMSLFFIYSSFNSLYKEKLSISSRTLLQQYTYTDFAKYINILKTQENFAENSDNYLADRNFLEETEQNYNYVDYPDEYYQAKSRLFTYYNRYKGLKDEKYSEIQNRLNQTQSATGVKNLFILADMGIDGGYTVLFNTFYAADVGTILHDDFGTAVSKSSYPEIQHVFETGETVYVIDKAEKDGKISHSFVPVTDGHGNIVAVIGVNVNLESISEEMNKFLLLSISITVLILAATILMMYLMLQKIIIRPVKKLTDISAEIAKGNVYAEIPEKILSRKDEMGVLGNSYESMRTALEKLIVNNNSLFEDIIIGKLETRGESSQFSGLFARLIDSMNETLDVIGFYFDSTPASFIIIGPDYDIVFSNKNFKKTFAGISQEQLYQGLLEESGDDNGNLKEKLAAVISKGEYDCLRWFDIDGEQRCYAFMCSGVAFAADKNGAAIVILDNTELVRAKDEAVTANKAKSEFLSRVSHELRTPLNAILSMAKLGLNDDQLSQSMSRFEKIVSSSEHLSNIINDVLEMSRMESGKTEIRYAPLNITTLIDDCVTMLVLKAQENNNELIQHVAPDIPASLIGDEFRIKQIIFNLLSNAIKFTNDGKIAVDVVCLEKTGENYKIQFTVTDTGIGMSQEFLVKIFLPFEQEDNFLTRRYAGSGLGLSISHNLITLMGGTMEVTSELGKGSKFVFVIDFELADAEHQVLQEDEDTYEDISLVGKKILLADDIEINRMIIIEVFNEFEVVIDEAGDGEEALEKFKNSPEGYYDCILMDIQMPKMNGYLATSEIRKTQRKDNNIPIIAMTANALKEDIDQAMESGMNGHLAKPIDFDLCIKTVKKYCSGR